MNFIFSFIRGIKLQTILIIVGVALIGYIVTIQKKLENTQIQLAYTNNNRIALEQGLIKWEDRYGQEHVKTIMFNENLTNFKKGSDSVTQDLVRIIKEQNWDISKLKQASVISTKIQTSLVKEISTKLPDTVVDLSTKDIKNVITLSPYQIQSDIEIYNKQYILSRDSLVKTFIPYRYDFFIKRWFQQREKQTVVIQEVINSNPLIKTNDQKFIHIVGKKD